MTEIEAFLHFTASKKEHQAEEREERGSLSLSQLPTLDRPGRYSSIIIEEEEDDTVSRTI